MLQSYFFLKRLGTTVLGQLIGLLLASIPLAAQPVLVKDIYPGSRSDLIQSVNYSFKPEHLVNLNGVVYFSAFDPVYGRELWKSDGTSAGTVLVKDISLGRQDSDPAGLVAINNTLYFSAGDGSGRELWKSDGTSAGTVKVKDINPGAAGSGPYELVNLVGTLYFVADDGASGNELWKSNGTAAGTVRVKDILPGAGSAFADGGFGSEARPYLTPVNGTLYFTANNGVNGFELWKSNGTPDGTVLVKDEFTGEYTDYQGAHPNSSWPIYLTNVNGTLFFSAYHSEVGWELYKSDGTIDGTTLIQDIEPGFSTFIEEFISSNPGDLTNVNGMLYFSASSGLDGRELWRSDGTPGGTFLLKDLYPGTHTVTHPYRDIQWQEPNHGNPEGLTNVNGTLFFTGGSGLWKSNGTAAGTAMVGNFPGAQNLTNVNGTLFFSYGNGLYKSTGTTGGTVLVKDMGPESSFNYNGALPYFTNVNGTLFFAALNGASGYQLWKSNGTAPGTVLVKGIPATIPASSTPQYLTDVNGTLYFSVNANPGGIASYELWKSNGTAGGTGAVKKIGPSIGQFRNVNGTLFFVADNGTNGLELWKSDGTVAGTGIVKDINPGAGDGVFYPGRMAVVNSTLYFVATDGASGAELWKTDGTAAGTMLVKDIYSGTPGSEPYWLTAVNGTLYFSAAATEGDQELWKSNGTAPGTVRVKDIHPGTEGSDITYLTNLNGTLYFNGNNGSGYSLWKSNGTDAGTVPVKAVPARSLTKMNNTLFFWGGSGTNGIELWKSDGTAPGTVLVKKIETGLYESYPAFLPGINGIQYFTTEHTAYGRELWRSDGTPGGTFLLKDLSPGTSGSNIEYTATLGNELYFSSGYNNETQSMWRSAGTAASTLKVSDVSVYDLAPMNGVLYFAGENSATGYELWKYDPAACATPNAATALQGSAVCLGSPATVTVKAAQTGVRYQLYYGASAVGLPQSGAGSDLAFTIPATSLSAGTYTFTARAAGCVETTLTQTATVAVSSPLAAPVAAGKTISSGQATTLTATGAPAGAVYRWYAVASGGMPLATGSSYSTPTLTATTTYYAAAFLSSCGESPRTAVTVTVSGVPAAGRFRVNAGGNAFATIDARAFAADTYFSGGGVSTTTTLAIGSTADDYLYQTGRHGASFAYNFPTGNGAYDVVLHFAETYFGNSAAGGTGSRKFHVDVEGARKLTDYDIFSKAGGALKATQETFRVNVSDGTLNVNFLKGAADNPAVKAIEVLPAGSALAVNSGGSAFRTAAGKAFSADVYYADGAVSSPTTADIANTTDDALYQTARFGPSFSYGLPSGNGTFDVILHFSENYFGSRAGGGAGSRRFNVYVEGIKRLSDYDVFAKAGGALKAIKETVRVTVTDGVLNLYFAKGSADNAIVSAIEVVPATAAARLAGAGAATAEDWQVGLFPNPVRDKLTVTLPFAASQVSGTVVTDVTGEVRLLDTHQARGENELEIRTEGLPGGLYLLRLDAPQGSKLVRFVKQ